MNRDRKILIKSWLETYRAGKISVGALVRGLVLSVRLTKQQKPKRERRLVFNRYDRSVSWVYSVDPQGESYRMVKLGGEAYEPYMCGCSHCESGRDCCGHWFCNSAHTKWGFLHFATYYLNV